MKRSAVSWMTKHIRKHIPALILMVAVDIV